MLGVLNLSEFKKQLTSRGNKICYTIAFPKIEIGKPEKGDVAIEFKFSDEYLVIKDDIQINSGDDVNKAVKLFYESYLQRICEMLLKECY